MMAATEGPDIVPQEQMQDVGGTAYTLRTWGEDQTLRYLDDLEACCRMLADRPALGRACDHIRPGLAIDDEDDGP